MPNSTVEYWDVDGTSLNQYAWNIQSWGGEREVPPELRGDDLTVSHIPGDIWMPKMVSSRTISLGMFVVGMQADGTLPTNHDVIQQFRRNYRTLRQLLWTPRRRFALTKRFYDILGTLHTATAQGQFANDLSPAITSPGSGNLALDIQLADPYFYENAATFPLSNGSNTVTIEGDDVTRAIGIHIAGARSNVTIANTTLGISVTFPGTIVSGDSMDIDVKNFKATYNPASNPAYNASGAITHGGDYAWLLLAPGANTIVVSSTGGTGTVTLTVQNVWL